MMQLLFHLWGDYITQNEWMSKHKAKRGIEGLRACLIHCLLYSAPFAFISSQPAWCVIFFSHFFIDRYRLAIVLIRIKNWEWDSDNFGFGKQTPIWLSTWLFIIIDNILHVTINYLAIRFL